MKRKTNSKSTSEKSKTGRTTPEHPTTRYALDVRDGRILAGRLVRLACLRHLRDLDQGHARGLRFDEEAATDAIEFFRFLQLAEGEHAGKPFKLQPWQQFIVGSLFGWKGKDGYRRFRTAYLEIAKGSGKTPLAAGLGLYGLLADGEEGAEIYAAAVTLKQAKIAFADAEKMVEASPFLKKRVESTVNNLCVVSTNSFFRPISSEKRGLDGPRVHMAIVDELHEHNSPIIVDKIRAGLKGRRQPLVIEITNSGYDRTSVCWNHHHYSQQILDGVFDNDSWFAFICGLDACEKCRNEGLDRPTDDCPDCDDWRDEGVWVKANPNLDVSVTRKYLREQVQEAIEMPSKMNIVLRLNFCIWTQQSVRWLNLDLWDRGSKPILPMDLSERRCYMGLDLARTNDMSALAILFPPVEGNEPWKVIMRYWIPNDDIQRRVRKDHVPYDVWVREGYVATTPGNATDFEFIEAEIIKLCGLYDVKEVAYDRTFADSMVNRLTTEGITMVPYAQNFTAMTMPCAELQRLLLAQRLQHGANPVLRWNAANVAVVRDSQGNMKPDKVGSLERIDGVVALLNALGRAMLGPQDEPTYQLLFIG